LQPNAPTGERLPATTLPDMRLIWRRKGVGVVAAG